MSSRLKDVLRASRAGTGAGGTRRVLVALNVPEANPETLDELRAIGLAVESVIGNKVVGAIADGDLARLRASPRVADVEESTTLRPHRN